MGRVKFVVEHQAHVEEVPTIRLSAEELALLKRVVQEAHESPDHRFCWRIAQEEPGREAKCHCFEGPSPPLTVLRLSLVLNTGREVSLLIRDEHGGAP